MKQKNNLEAICKACKIVGGQAAMSRVLGISSPTVNQWATGIRQVPAERCPEIEKATKGRVACEDLRPDVDWKYLRGNTLVRTDTSEDGIFQERELQPQEQGVSRG